VTDLEVSTNRTMRLVALLLLGGWAGVTVLIGLMDVVNGYENWRSFHTSTDGFPRFFQLGPSAFLLWIASWNLILPALVLGIIQTARVHRQAWTPMAFAAVAITGPIISVVFNQVRNGGDDLRIPDHLVSWDVLGGLGFVGIAAVTMLAAWVLLRNVGTADERQPAY